MATNFLCGKCPIMAPLSWIELNTLPFDLKRHPLYFQHFQRKEKQISDFLAFHKSFCFSSFKHNLAFWRTLLILSLWVCSFSKMAFMNYSGEQITPFCPNRVLIGNLQKKIDIDWFLKFETQWSDGHGMMRDSKGWTFYMKKLWDKTFKIPGGSCLI